jgi:hypothetical protein
LGFDAGIPVQPLPEAVMVTPVAIHESGARVPQARHCERSEAIQTVAAEGFWIASLRSQ